MSEAMAGIDIALWDIAGKVTGLPIHLLMGGDYHEAVRVYQSHLPVLDPDEMVALAQGHAHDGYHGIKISGGVGAEIDIRNVERIREGVGDAIELMQTGRYRNVPIVDDRRHLVGVVRQVDIIKYLAESFPEELLNLPPRPHQRMRHAEGG